MTHQREKIQNLEIFNWQIVKFYMAFISNWSITKEHFCLLFFGISTAPLKNLKRLPEKIMPSADKVR